MRSRKLSGNLRQKVTQGLRRATIQALGYDRKASRAVAEYFENLSKTYLVRSEEISIQIRLKDSDQKEPETRLFLRGNFHQELPTEELISIFAGPTLAQLPAFRQEVRRRVAEYLIRLRTEAGASRSLRISLSEGKPLVHAESESQIRERIDLLSLIEQFYGDQNH